MNLAVIGSGGREHAICYKLKQSPKIQKLICIPGNAGTEKIAKNIYEILDMKGFSRSEFIIENDEIFLLEVNSVPGLTNESILPKQASAAGIELKDLFSNAINEAIN